MSRAEKFIEDCTRNCSNEIEWNEGGLTCHDYVPWLTPDQARKAVEIAREEMIKKACDTYCKVCGHYAHTVPTHICRHDCRYYSDFKQAMKDE